MAKVTNDNFDIRKQAPADNRLGKLVNGIWQPFDSVAEAHSLITYKYRTLTVPVIVAGQVVEYWYKDAAVNQSDLILKTTASTGGGATKDSFTLPSVGTRTVNGPSDLITIRVNPVSGLGGFKVGTTNDGDDIIQSQRIVPGWKSFNINQFLPANTVLYFGGISSSTQVCIITL